MQLPKPRKQGKTPSLRLPKFAPCNWLGPQGKNKPFVHIDRWTSARSYLVLWVPADINQPAVAGDPDWKNPEDWHKIYHQTAGTACLHMTFWAKFLRPRPHIQVLMDKIADTYDDCGFHSPVTLSRAAAYEALLQTEGLSANHTYSDLQEGFYPLDIECLSYATAQRISLSRLTNSLKWKERPLALDKLWHSCLWTRFSLAILTENSD
jgi:hypothetical protein